MTKESFKEYLESIGGVYDWRGRNHTNPYIFGVDEGWFDLLKNLIDELIVLGWDRHLIQSKEKFGALRFYTKETTDEMRHVIMNYERLSYTICEKCGKEGKPRTGGWIKTLCDYHSELETKKEKYDLY